MKTLYNVSEQDYGYHRSYGTFADETVAQALADRINKFKGRDDERDGTRACVYKELVCEEGDRVFTHCAVYHISDDLYEVNEECPTMFDGTLDIEWFRECLNDDSRRHLTYIHVYGHSAEHAQMRCMEFVEQLKAESLIQLHRERLVAWQEEVDRYDSNEE